MPRHHWKPLLAFVALACANEAPSTPALAPAAHDMSHGAAQAAPLSAHVAAQVVELKALMAKYHSWGQAVRDDYTTAITGCMENQPIGGMGVHYADTRLIDGAVTPLQPEVLIYAPGPNGQKQFVGVEFIVPFTAWTSPTPPVAYGQTFAANQTFQVWALHVWVGRDNPRGIFADWNPRVSCS